MKLTTRSRYGVRMMYELALKYGKEAVTIREIAKRQKISEKYISKLIIPLMGAQLVISMRGSHGGYILASEPSKIILRDIVEVMEGKISMGECILNRNNCGKTNECPTCNIWRGLDNVIYLYLEGITLEDIVKRGSSLDEIISYNI